MHNIYAKALHHCYYTNDSMHICSNTSCYNVTGKDCHHRSLIMVSWLHAYALVARVQLKDSKMSALSLLGTQIIIISSWNHGAYYRLCADHFSWLEHHIITVWLTHMLATIKVLMTINVVIILYSYRYTLWFRSQTGYNECILSCFKHKS